MARDRRRAAAEHAKGLMRIVHGVTGGNAERATLELSVRQRLIIQCLGLEGSRSMAALGQRLGLTPSTMTGLVDRLEEQGFVRRESHPSDRRVSVVRLSRKGENAFGRELDFYRALVDGTLEPLGEDAKRLVLEALMALANSDVSADAA